MASSLKGNIIANYAGQFYVSVIGILILPLYSKILGAESFGLVAFFSVIQAAFAILDMGLSPTISRETVKFKAKSISQLSYSHFLRSVSFIFIAIAITGALLIFSLSDFISQRWITAETISAEAVSLCISIMGAVAALRWYSALHRGVLIGCEKFVWLNIYNVISSTARYVFVLPILFFYGDDVVYYFIFQFSISLLEVFFLRQKSIKLNSTGTDVPYSFTSMLKELRSRLAFTSNIALTSVVWLVIVNADKIYASAIFELDSYGYFVMITSLASGLMIIASPISATLLPRLTSIAESQSNDYLYQKYSQFTKMTVNLVMPVCFYMAIFSEHILRVWTQSDKVVEFGTNVLTLYAVGYVFLILSSIPYRLQYAKGELKYHVVATIIFLFIHIPLVCMLTKKFGAIGSGLAWLASNVINFVFLALFVHPKFIGKKAIEWLFVSVGIPLMKSLFLIVALAILSTFLFEESFIVVVFSLILVSIYIYFFQIRKGLLND